MGQNRIGRSGGGTGIMYRDSLNVKRIDGGEHESFEFSEWMVSGRSTKKLRVVIINFIVLPIQKTIRSQF